MKTVFTRQTDKGLLTCKVSGTGIYFDLGGKEIKKKSIAGIVPIEKLKNEKIAEAIYPILVKKGAVAMWNYQVALYGDEPQKIAEAQEESIKEKREQAEAEKARVLAQTDIIITEKTQNGYPKKAENERFSWFFGQEDWLFDKQAGRMIYQMSWMNTDSFGSVPLPEEDIKLVRKFFYELAFLKAESKKQEQKQKQEEPPCAYENMTEAERKKKEQEYDDLYNEGGEGYNPYRLPEIYPVIEPRD